MLVTEFLAKYPVTISSTWAARNPHMENTEHMNNYKSTLKFQGRRFTLHFSKGIGLEGEPTVAEVLECLAMDIRYLSDGVEEFVDSMGYTRSKGAYIYKVIEKQSDKMYALLGNAAFLDFRSIEED